MRCEPTLDEAVERLSHPREAGVPGVSERGEHPGNLKQQPESVERPWVVSVEPEGLCAVGETTSAHVAVSSRRKDLIQAAFRQAEVHRDTRLTTSTRSAAAWVCGPAFAEVPRCQAARRRSKEGFLLRDSLMVTTMCGAGRNSLGTPRRSWAEAGEDANDPPETLET